MNCKYRKIRYQNKLFYAQVLIIQRYKKTNGGKKLYKQQLIRIENLCISLDLIERNSINLCIKDL